VADTAPKPVPASAPDEATVNAQVDAAIRAANQSMKSVATNLKFEKDSDSGRIVVRVIDSDTQQVLRQMPSEEMLAMSKALDRLQGLMVRHKV
jgi:flagellar protein FlaG